MDVRDRVEGGLPQVDLPGDGGPPGAGRRKSIGESPSLRWTLMTDPEPPTPEMIASVKALVSALVAAGWERTGTGAAWYAQRFVWRGSGEPRAVAVPGDDREPHSQAPRSRQGFDKQRRERCAGPRPPPLGRDQCSCAVSSSQPQPPS